MTSFVNRLNTLVTFAVLGLAILCAGASFLDCFHSPAVQANVEVTGRRPASFLLRRRRRPVFVGAFTVRCELLFHEPIRQRSASYFSRRIFATTAAVFLFFSLKIWMDVSLARIAGIMSGQTLFMSMFDRISTVFSSFNWAFH